MAIVLVMVFTLNSAVCKQQQNSIKKKLIELKELFEQNLLSEQVYTSLQKELLHNQWNRHPQQSASHSYSKDPTIRSKDTIIFQDEFDTFDMATWKHELTFNGGDNWEFQQYVNNRTNSYVRNGTLFIVPSFQNDVIGDTNLYGPYTASAWGSEPADLCTSNEDYGCERLSGVDGGVIINPIRSARLRTVESFSFKHGRLEARLKLPRGDWLWPTLWMKPTYQMYGSWPASGEIDLVEARGNANYAPGGIDKMFTTMHFGNYYPNDPFELAEANVTAPSGEDFASKFHLYGMYWDNNTFYTYLDKDTNKIFQIDFTEKSFWQRGLDAGIWTNDMYNPWVGRGNAAPFDQEFYLILNVAVGGTTGWFPDGLGNKPWTNADPLAERKFWEAKSQWFPTWKGEDAALQVDWIRVYKIG